MEKVLGNTTLTRELGLHSGTLKTYSIDLLSCLEMNYQNPARRTISTELTTTKESKDIYVCIQKVIVT